MSFGDGNATVTAEIPAPILERAILEVAAELFHRKKAPNGIKQFADPSGMPGQAVRVARDPMAPAYALLAPFIPAGIA